MFEVPPKGAHDASRPKGAHEGAHVVRVLGAMDRVEPEPAAPCVAVGAAGRNRRDGSGEASRRASVWRGARQGGKVWEVGLAYEVWRAAVGGTSRPQRPPNKPPKRMPKQFPPRRDVIKIRNREAERCKTCAGACLRTEVGKGMGADPSSVPPGVVEY